MVEQRYLAVREVRDTGATVTGVATRYGVDRRTLHRWLVRYANDGMPALADRSSRPDRCPHQIKPEVEVLIVSMRRAHPGRGPRTLLSKLKLQIEHPPSRSAIYRCLIRHRLIEPAPRKRKAKDYRRWERSRAMELWQMDVMGGVHLTDGTALSVVTGIDDYSRSAFSPNWSSGPPPSRCDGLTAPYSPTTTGKIERVHKTMCKEFFAVDATFDTIELFQEALDGWVCSYNTERTHQAIGDVVPLTRFELRGRTQFEVVDGSLPDAPAPPPPRNVVGRKVDQKGRIRILKHRYHVGVHLRDKP
jgi:transposase InsO family protein